ncbi:MAG: M28 family peptidase [Candidatus Rokubacteria bacterium]|nr:M28 family peptidase [Candidatus Rokubacteria bacterium]MBI3826169.1 M28 family peptidase [Candidatus Rokubacteria bacterium]
MLSLVTALAAVGPGAAVTAQPATPARASRFDGAVALRHIERLVTIGPRAAGSPASGRARDYIVAELRKAGAQVRVLAFDADTPNGRLKMANVIGVVPGRRPDAVMIAGHYDTKWFPDFRFVGANDGGSSTALVLELARTLAAAPREFTYWLALLDGEEAFGAWTATDSLYGSRRLAQDLARRRELPRAVIVADMIGDRDLAIRREAFSTPWLTDAIWASAHALGFDRHFLADATSVEDDHVPFLQAGVPATLLIDFDYPPWHTAGDTLDKVSAQSLQVVGDVLLGALPAIEAHLAREGGGKR